jgi:O-antigen/teichoic acid export membrane protein
MFAASFALAEPVTVLLFGERYANSGVILALLAFGYYFNAALGFNADTLRVYGRIRYIVIIDFTVMVIAVLMNLLFISQWGAVGAAVSSMLILVIQNILNHLGLLLGTSIRLFDWHYLRTYVTIIVGTLVLVVIQAVFDPPIYIGLPLTGLVSGIIVLLNRSVLDVADTFPELLKIPLVKYLFPRPSEQLAGQP